MRRGGAAGGRGGRRWRGAKGPRRAHLAYRAAWRARGGRERVTEKRKTEQSILEGRGAEDRLLRASPRRVCSRRTDAQTPCRKVLLPPSDATRTGIDPSLASTAALSAARRGKGDSSQRGLVCEGQAIGSVAPGSSGARVAQRLLRSTITCRSIHTLYQLPPSLPRCPEEPAGPHRPEREVRRTTERRVRMVRVRPVGVLRLVRVRLVPGGRCLRGAAGRESVEFRRRARAAESGAPAGRA